MTYSFVINAMLGPLFYNELVFKIYLLMIYLVCIYVVNVKSVRTLTLDVSFYMKHTKNVMTFYLKWLMLLWNYVYIYKKKKPKYDLRENWMLGRYNLSLCRTFITQLNVFNYTKCYSRTSQVNSLTKLSSHQLFTLDFLFILSPHDFSYLYGNYLYHISLILA